MLLIEMRKENQEWLRTPSLKQNDPPGSMSNNTETGRDLYLFQCLGDYSVISKSNVGMDAEVNNGKNRLVISNNFSPVSILKNGESFVMKMKMDNMSTEIDVMFTHRDDNYVKSENRN